MVDFCGNESDHGTSLKYYHALFDCHQSCVNGTNIVQYYIETFYTIEEDIHYITMPFGVLPEVQKGGHSWCEHRTITPL